MWEGEAPAETGHSRMHRLGRSLALPNAFVPTQSTALSPQYFSLNLPRPPRTELSGWTVVMAEFDPGQFEALRAGLRRMHEAGPKVPGEIDEAILADARRSFAARRRRWALVQRIGGGLAAAAVLAIAIRVFYPPSNSTSPVRPLQRSELAQAADVNRDGRVDILDAYVVARHIARHQPLEPAWDVNGDGVVDQRDVDLIAHMAVQTTEGMAR